MLQPENKIYKNLPTRRKLKTQCIIVYKAALENMYNAGNNMS